MNHEYIQIDTYNNNVSCKFNNTTYLFASVEDFINNTGFPYNIGLLSWEPSRDHYVVERLTVPPSYGYGDTLPEMLWISDNRDNLIDCCIRYQQAQPKGPEFTITDARNIKLWETDFVLKRHEEEQILSLSTTISTDKLREVLVYRQALRDITKIYNSLDTVIWPLNPLE